MVRLWHDGYCCRGNVNNMAGCIGEFTVVGKMPTINEMVAASKIHFAVYSKMKKKWTNMAWAMALKEHVPAAEHPVIIKMTWFETTKSRRDPDNVVASKKFILDGLVKAKVIKDDSHKYVRGFIDRVEYKGDKHCVRVQVFSNP